jgi:hypothetical protein
LVRVFMDSPFQSSGVPELRTTNIKIYNIGLKSKYL